ncbi:MAG: hypothetical protein KGI54_07645 [Pseudomonadota bacterium]|nr:hypothetical protein [Pseudomonadota bacterium]
MTLTPTLTSIKSLFWKLERESYCAYHAHSKIHKADHFFNFCVTAHSLRDYILEHLGKVTAQEKEAFHNLWSAMPLLHTVGEIANSFKHFRLQEPKAHQLKSIETKHVGLKKSKFIDIYENSTGDIKFVEILGNDIAVTLSDGQRFELYAFTHEALTFWKSELQEHGIIIRSQSLTRLNDG